MPFTFVWLWVLSLCMHIQSMYIFTSFLRFSLFSDHTCFYMLMLTLNEHLIVHTFSAHPFQYISNVLSIPFQYSFNTFPIPFVDTLSIPFKVPFQCLWFHLWYIFNTFKYLFNTLSIHFQYLLKFNILSILFKHPFQHFQCPVQ